MTEKGKLHIDLVAHQGHTSVNISAAINASGDVVFSGQDLGAAPLAVFGRDEYEYWLTVSANHKHQLLGILIGPAQTYMPADLSANKRDLLLLDLIEKRYRGDQSLVTHLRTLLDQHGIPYSFSTY